MVQRSPDALPCTRVREDIDARLSGRLPAARTAVVDAHLQRCPACHAELELAAAIRSELSGLPRFDAPPRVIEAIRRQVREVGSPPQARPSGRSAGGRFRARAALAAAAAAAFALAAVLMLPGRILRTSQHASAVEVAQATAEARFAFSLVAGAATTAQDELRHGVLGDRVMAPALRGLSRAVIAHPRSSSAQRLHPTPNISHGGSS
jgi:anti-sigma factor RsiW